MKKLFLLLLLVALYINALTQIQGFVYDQTSGQPLSGCVVRIKEINKATLTDDKGFFSFKNLPHGTFTLEFSFLGYETFSEQVAYKQRPVTLKVYLKPSPIQTEEVIVTGWVPNSQHTSSMKVDKIDLNLSQQLLPSVLYSLTTVPGVDVISKGIAVGTPVIRGLSKTNIVVLNNGFRMENYQFSENHPFFIDNLGNERIEIIKGPSSLFYGSDAIGGVINIVWEEPAYVNHYISDLMLRYNSNTHGINTLAGYKFSNEKNSFGIKLGYNLNGDMHDGNGSQLKNTRFLMQNLKAFLINNTAKSTHKFYFQADRNKLGLCVKPALTLVNDQKLFPEKFYQDLTHLFFGNKNTFFINNSTHIHANISYEFNHRGLRKIATEPMPIDMKLNSINYELYSDVRQKSFTLIAGTQGWWVQNTNLGTEIFLPDYKTFNSALFALLRLKWNQQINLISGIRYDLTLLRINPPTDTLSPINAQYGNLSASLGMTLNLGKHSVVRFNSATAYRNPNAAELAEAGIHAFRFEVGNPALKPQKSFENDLSLHLHYQKLIFDLALFHNKIRNYIYLAPTADTTSEGMKIYTYQQKDATIYGLETGANFSFSAQWQTKLTFSYIKTQDINHEPLPLTPQNKLRAFVTYKLLHIGPIEQLSLTLNPVYAFRYAKPAQNELPSDPYLIVNASAQATAKVQKHELTFMLNIFNLTNAIYSDHLSTLRDVGYFDMGRNISIGIRWRLDRKIHAAKSEE